MTAIVVSTCSIANLLLIGALLAATEGFDDKNHDLTTVRICFQAYLPDQTGKYCRAIRPIVSQCIFDKSKLTYF